MSGLVRAVPCERPGCTRPLRAKGLCAFHYDRKRRGTPLDAPIRRTANGEARRYAQKCAVSWCDRPMEARGLYQTHYVRSKRGADLDAPFLVRCKNEGRDCSVDGCDRSAKTRGLCNAHYLRLRTGRAVDTPLRQYGIGRRRETRSGYILTYVGTENGSGSYVYEHRHVMEQLLGRPLRPGETVHHKNGAKDDNRSENLELWMSSHTPGQRAADLLAWARQIIAEYEPHADVIS